MKDTYFDTRLLSRKGVLILYVGAILVALYFLTSYRSGFVMKSPLASIVHADDTSAVCSLEQKDKKDVLFIGCGGFL